MADPVKALDAAIAWHLKLPELADDEWPDFTTWLEADPDHAAAFDLVAQTDVRLDTALRQSHAAPKSPQAARRLFGASRRFSPSHALAGAVAACLAIAGFSAFQASGPALDFERTAPGSTRQIALPDGTGIDLNGDSDLALDHNAARYARLDRGEARFTIRHGREPFVVEAAGFRMQDLGTAFNVAVTPGRLQLSVSEGSVLFDPGGANLTVGAGEQVTVERARNLVVKRRGQLPGDWLHGELAFENAPMGEVVAAIHRRSGYDLSLSAGLSRQLFTGNIKLSGDPVADVPHFAALIGAEYHRDGAQWLITDTGKLR